MTDVKNVLGGQLAVCGTSPKTGFYGDGCCNTGTGDVDLHLVCARVTSEFLEFSQYRGNDLMTPIPLFAFAGLKAGDRWCLCVQRWKEALQANVAPPVDLSATHVSALEFVDLETLKAHSLDPAVCPRKSVR